MKRTNCRKLVGTNLSPECKFYLCRGVEKFQFLHSIRQELQYIPASLPTVVYNFYLKTIRYNFQFMTSVYVNTLGFSQVELETDKTKN